MAKQTDCCSCSTSVWLLRPAPCCSRRWPQPLPHLSAMLSSAEQEPCPVTTGNLLLRGTSVQPATQSVLRCCGTKRFCEKACANYSCSMLTGAARSNGSDSLPSEVCERTTML